MILSVNDTMNASDMRQRANAGIERFAKLRAEPRHLRFVKPVPGDKIVLGLSRMRTVIQFVLESAALRPPNPRTSLRRARSVFGADPAHAYANQEQGGFLRPGRDCPKLPPEQRASPLCSFDPAAATHSRRNDAASQRTMQLLSDLITGNRPFSGASHEDMIPS